MMVSPDKTFESALERMPPQNIEAEEAILGGILLDPGALERVLEILKPESFYISAHQTLYRSTVALHQSGAPTDIMGVAQWRDE